MSKHDIKFYPIDGLSEDDGYVLVFCDPKTRNPWTEHCVAAKRVGDYIQPMFSSGFYQGAMSWTPFPKFTNTEHIKNFK